MRHRRALIILAVLQGLLLYLTASRLAGGGTLYGCSLFCGQPSANVLRLTSAAFGIALFVIPSLIGALCRSWQGAIALAVAPWWVAILAHAGTMLTPYIGLGGSGGRFDSPFWLDINSVALLLLSLALFAALGYFGWLARHAINREFRASQPA